MKNVLMCVLGSCLFWFCGCEDYKKCKEITNEDMIIKAISNGSVVNIRDDNFISIDGIIVGTLRKGIVEGCFGYPWCVAIDEQHKGLIKISTDDFVIYDDNEETTGTLYFSTDFYSPYWYSDGSASGFREEVDNYGMEGGGEEDAGDAGGSDAGTGDAGGGGGGGGGGEYQSKRQACCANNPEKCHCYE